MQNVLSSLPKDPDEYQFKQVRCHVEVYLENRFILSDDTMEEAYVELCLMLNVGG